MVDKIIPPRRDEVLTEGGRGSIRTMEYLERTATQVNNSTELTETDPSSINLSGAQIAQINKKISAIVSESLLPQASLIAKLNKRIDQLESALIAPKNNDKQFTQLENDFTAPFYKAKYDKLTIKNAFISNLSVIDLINGPSGVWGMDGINLNSGKAYEINNISVLTETNLGLGVVNSKLTSLGVLTTVDTSGEYKVNNIKVVGDRGSAISDPLATVNSLQIAVINILDALRPAGHGLIDV